MRTLILVAVLLPMTDELRVKTRELLAAVRKMREPKALPAKLTDPSIINGHAHDDDTA
jgi:hypothetical protein